MHAASSHPCPDQYIGCVRSGDAPRAEEAGLRGRLRNVAAASPYTPPVHATDLAAGAGDSRGLSSTRHSDDYRPLPPLNTRASRHYQGGAQACLCIDSPLVELKPPHSVTCGSHLDVALTPDRAVCLSASLDGPRQ